MDGFSYNNIFDTKGIEYLIIIAFLLLIIPFWFIINKKASVSVQVKKTIGILSEDILKIPLGLYYSVNHAWTHLEKSGIAKVGLDDFLIHVSGEVKFRELKKPGNFINKGEALADIDQNGKLLQIYSPISGRVIKTNKMLYATHGIVNEDPYDRGWIYEIQPSEWMAETSSYYVGNEAVAWVKNEIVKFRDFLALSMKKYSPETSMLMLQDGGELIDRPLSELPDEVWQDSQKSFLNRSF